MTKPPRWNGVSQPPTPASNSNGSTHQFLSDKVLDWFIRSGMLEEQVTARGSTNYSAIRPHHVLKFEIPLPPLTEQRRIVTRIEALAARIAEAQSLRREAEEEASIIVRSARNEIFGHLQKTTKPVRFDEIAEMRLGKMLSQASKVTATPLPYLRNANIQWDRLDLSTVNEMDFAESEKPIFRLRVGDILVCEGGDIGKSALWNDELPECYFQKALHRIRVNLSITFPRFILNHIFWGAEQKHFFGLKTQTTIPHLTGDSTAKRVLLPSSKGQKFNTIRACSEKTPNTNNLR